MKDSKNYVLITTPQADMSENHDERFKYRDKMLRTSGGRGASRGWRLKEAGGLQDAGGFKMQGTSGGRGFRRPGLQDAGDFRIPDIAAGTPMSLRGPSGPRQSLP